MIFFFLFFHSGNILSKCLGVLNYSSSSQHNSCAVLWAVTVDIVLKVMTCTPCAVTLFLGIKIKTLYLGFFRSQVPFPVMGMNHMLAELACAVWRESVFILLPLSLEVFRTHKSLTKYTVLQLFLARCWPLGSFSFRASSLHDHPSQRDDLIWIRAWWNHNSSKFVFPLVQKKIKVS